MDLDQKNCKLNLIDLKATVQDMAASAFDTVYPADTVEFCPHLDALDIFACGTYKLEHPPSQSSSGLGEPVITQNVGRSLVPQQRRGQCLLFQVDPASDQGFRQIQTLNFPAIPDIKWCHRSQVASPVMGIADSEGGITLLEWQDDERALKQIDYVRCAPPDTLCLSLDWSNRRAPGTDLGNLIVSLSNGSLCLLRPSDERGLTLTESWKAHDYEPWVTAWNYWDTNFVYSGGDDLKLKAWDLRQNFQQPLFNKRFGAGVTSIQSHPNIEYIFAVGSYDDTVRLFDMRRPLTPLTEVNVGGGAWRVKWHPSSSRKGDLLVACMHDGFKVIHFNTDEDETRRGEVVKRFDSHKSLAYGADWSFRPQNDETLIGTCSFYDHAFHLWSG